MKKMLLGILLACSATGAHAFDQQGVFIGGGWTAITLEDCPDCDSSGLMLEAGFDINRTVGLEIKIAQTSPDSLHYDPERDVYIEYDDVDMTYIGANLGSDFGTHWFKLYGKLGMAHFKESAPGYQTNTDTNIALGVGVRFTPVEDQRGFYIKLDLLSSRFLDWDAGVGTFALGYKF